MDESEGAKTLVAARGFKRRLLLKQAAAGVVLALAPNVISAQARAASRELSLLVWSSLFPDILKGSFEAETGVTLKVSTYESNEELLNKMKATRGRGVDLIVPSMTYGKVWEPLGLLLPWDMERVPVDRIAPAPLKAAGSQWAWQEGGYLLPYLWGGEGLAWRSDAWERGQEALSYGDLWRPEMKGLVMGRARSLLIGIGLYLDAKEIVPSNRLLDAYEDQDRMSRIFVEITKFAIQQKRWVKLFWDGAEAQQMALLQGGVLMGQVWDGPMLALQSAGAPLRYSAPQEGALAWMDGLAIPAGARNFDAIYAFLDLLYRPETSALLHKLTGYHAASTGALDYLSEAAHSSFAQAYPADALDRLWWWPAQPAWFAAALASFGEQYLQA